MKKAGIYCRVSTAEQVLSGFSIDEQKERLAAYCKAMGWQVVGQYIDGGFSGSDTDRPALQQMIKEIKSIDVVVVYKLDRLSRRQKDTLFLIEDVLIKNGVDIVSLQESLDTTSPFGRAAIGILAAFAQLERETFKERSLLGRTGRARIGKWLGTSRPPIGYDYNVEKQELTINEYEAMQIKEIFELYLKGTGLQRIAKVLHEKGYTQKYSDWKSWGSISIILQNPVYTGNVTFAGKTFEGQHEAIISDEDFNRVQEKLLARSTGELYKRKSPFTPFLVCGNCGAKMFYLSAKKHNPKYVCYSRFGQPAYAVKDKNCKMTRWDAPKLEEKILGAIKNLALNKVLIPKAVNNANDKPVKNRIDDIDKQISKLLDAFSIDGISKTEISAKVAALHSEKNQLKITLSEQPPINAKKIKSTAKEIVENWETKSLMQKIEYLKGLLVTVIVQPDDIEIIWTFPLYE